MYYICPVHNFKNKIGLLYPVSNLNNKEYTFKVSTNNTFINRMFQV